MGTDWVTDLTAQDYDANEIELVRSLALTIAVALGDLCDDDVVVVGGLVPPLLIDQRRLPSDVDRHVGTKDLDLALSVALLDEQRYEAVAAGLDRAGFARDLTDRGTRTRQRWVAPQSPALKVEFLMPKSTPDQAAGDLQSLTGDLAAFIIDGLEVAWIDRIRCELTGTTLDGTTATRRLWVCGPAAYVVLKALACRGRNKDKDKYDLYYVIRNFGEPRLETLRKHVELLPDTPVIARALGYLREDFGRNTDTGPRAVCRFQGDAESEERAADVVAFVREFVQLLDDRVA